MCAKMVPSVVTVHTLNSSGSRQEAWRGDEV
jgi:hypothetical protein